MKFYIEKTDSDFIWYNFEIDNNRVGKARCRLNSQAVIIYSIFISESHRNMGFARKFIEVMKSKKEKVIADRVRFSAIKFWQKLGFEEDGFGNYIYSKDE